MEAPAMAQEVEAEGEAERPPAALQESARLEGEARRAAVNSDGDLLEASVGVLSRESLEERLGAVERPIEFEPLEAMEPLQQAVAALTELVDEAAPPSTRPSDIPEAFLCPITFALMDDPVVMMDGMTYERRAIETWLSKGQTTSPLTGAELQSTVLISQTTSCAARSGSIGRSNNN